MAHIAPDRRIASTENIAVIISLTLIVWLQHIDPNGGQDWGQPSNLRNVGLKSLAILVGRNGFAEDAGSEVDWIGECILSEGGQGCPSELQRKETTMSPLRARMIEDMTLAGLAEGTQRVYVQAVRGVTAHYRRSPDLLSEEEVRGYLLGLRQRGVARGTFQTSRYGLRFFYHHTLDRAWALFGGKKDRLATTEAAA